MPSAHQSGDRHIGPGEFARRIFIAITIAGLFFLAWHLRHTVILAFAAVVVAALLLAATDAVRRVVPLGHRWSLALSGLLVVLVIGAILWLGWPNIKGQSTNLLQQLGGAISGIEERTGIGITEPGGQLSGVFGRIVSDVASFVQTTAAAVTSFILVVIAGAFLALNPAVYLHGLTLLFPPGQRDRIDRALGSTGRAFKLWLVGQLLSMTIVGALVGLGAWAIGLPSPLALALFAFLTEFVPLIGPFVGAVPGLLLALGQGWSTLLWTALLYLAVQQVESNLITPIVQREMVRVPPALFMLSAVAMGALFGILGVVLAGPLTVTTFVLVRTLYVEDTLGEPLGRKRPHEERQS